MTIVGFVPTPDDAPVVAAWVQALTFEGETATYLCHEVGASDATQQALLADLGQRGDSDPSIEPIRDAAIVSAVVSRCRAANRLVTTAFDLTAPGGRTQTAEVLLQSAPCQTFCALAAGTPPERVKKILVIVSGGPHDRAALILADHLSRGGRSGVTVAGIEDRTSERAEQSGVRALKSILHDAALQDDDRFEIRVVVDRLRHRGVLSCVDDQDLVIAGLDDLDSLRPLRSSLGSRTAAVVKRDPPLRLRALPDWLPRINPSDHAELLDDLRQGSRFGPDFVGMLTMASAIASLGLLQDSPAVVIGSMLLAPLMTPMIGMGLSLAQANLKLAATCARSIVLGSLLTLGASYAVSLAAPTSATLSPETLARGGPNVLDLLIALFAAVAATFAMARPNLSGAIAGVAIATALVPPLCAVGISLEARELENAAGASVLFATNLVGIIVASWTTFVFLGVTSSHALSRLRRTSRFIVAALVLVLAALAAPLSFELSDQIEVGRDEPLTFPVTRPVSEAVFEFLEKDEDVDLLFLARSSVNEAVHVHLASQRDLPTTYASELRALIREVREDPKLPVVVVAVRGLWRSDHSGDD